MYKVIVLALVLCSTMAADAVTANTAACPNDEYCQTCGADNKCTYCANAYIDANGICQPPTTAIDDCFNYTSATVCSECQWEYYLSGNKCVKIDIDDCWDVNPTAPTKCTICGNGKLPTADGSCKDGADCTVEDCEACNSATTCEVCDDDYTVVSTKCAKETVDNCGEATGTVCTLCLDGYYASGNTCKESSVQENVSIFSAVALFAVLAKLFMY